MPIFDPFSRENILQKLFGLLHNPPRTQEVAWFLYTFSHIFGQCDGNIYTHLTEANILWEHAIYSMYILPLNSLFISVAHRLRGLDSLVLINQLSYFFFFYNFIDSNYISVILFKFFCPFMISWTNILINAGKRWQIDYFNFWVSKNINSMLVSFIYHTTGH